MNDSLKNNINEKVLMKIYCEIPSRLFEKNRQFLVQILLLNIPCLDN